MRPSGTSSAHELVRRLYDGETGLNRGAVGGGAESSQRKARWSPNHAGGRLFWNSRYRDGDVIVAEEMPVVLQIGLSPEAR